MFFTMKKTNSLSVHAHDPATKGVQESVVALCSPGVVSVNQTCSEYDPLSAYPWEPFGGNEHATLYEAKNLCLESTLLAMPS